LERALQEHCINVFAIAGFRISDSNNLKRGSSRIVGNIAHLFPNDLDETIQKLMVNTRNSSTVVRWGSAYALGRIIQIPVYANSGLYEILRDLCASEQENGVKGQLLNGLKKADKLRK
jgi:hypothetical protein